MTADPAQVLAEAERLHTQARAAINRYHAAEAKQLVAAVRATLLGIGDSASPQQTLRAQTISLRTQLTECWVVFEESGTGPAIASLKEAERAAAAHGNTEVIAAAELQKAVLLGRAGDQASALAAARVALSLRDAMAPTDEAILLLTLGNLTGALGSFDEAREALAEAANVAQSAGLADLEFMALHNGGHLEYLRGDLPRALTLMAQADEMDVGVDRSVAHLDRGRTLLDAGLLDEAREVLRGAAALAAAAHAWHDLAEAELESARCELLRGQNEEAIALARTAKRRFSSRGEHGWRCRALMVELEALSLLGADPGRRARIAAAVYGASHAIGDKMAAIQAALLWSEALVDSGELDLVAPVLAEAERFRDAPQIATRLHWAYVTVRYHNARGDTTVARRHATAAARELIAAKHASASIDLRTALSVHGGRLSQLDLRLAVESGQPRTVLERIELWRGAARGQAPVRPVSDAAEAELLTRLRNLRDDMRAARGADLAALEAEASTLYDRIRNMAWKAARAREPEAMHEEFPFDRLATSLADLDTSLVVMLSVAGKTSVVVMRPSGEMRLYPGPDPKLVAQMLVRVQADITAQTRVPPGTQIGDAVSRSLTKGLRQLDELLLGGADVAESAVVVAPTRELGPIPWSMLPSRRGVPTTVTRTATAWARGAVTLAAPAVTALAGPDLPHAAAEVDQVAQIWGPTSTCPDLPTGLDLLTALEASDLVHVAAHGEHQYENPLFSSIRMSDGAVFAHEFEGRPLRASHVVLSACEVGNTTARPAGESLGLASSLLELGVATVVAPVTVVPDDLAGEVMAAFHRKLAAGEEAARALAAATERKPPIAASFILFGAPWSVYVAQ